LHFAPILHKKISISEVTKLSKFWPRKGQDPDQCCISCRIFKNLFGVDADMYHWSPKKIYIERRPSFFAFSGIGTKMKKMRGIRR
jgi:hypothetical protein